MNILIDGRYVQDHFPGIGRYTYNLVRGLAELESGDHLAVFHNPALPNTRYDLSVLAGYPNVELVAADVPTFSPAEHVRLPRIIRQYLTRRTFGGSHAPPLFHSPYYVKPYFGLPCPSVVTIYDVISAHYPEYMPSWRARVAFELTTRLALATSDYVLTLSEASRRDLVALYGARPDRVAVTPLAADERFRPQPASGVDALRQKYDLPASYVLYLGINKPHKNLLTLVEAWKVLLDSAGAETTSASQMTASDDWSLTTGHSLLLLAGREDPRYMQVRRRVRELALGGSVRFLGDVPDEDLPALYSGAQLFVFPSLVEGFGLPVLEAMACGSPVVCSDTSSLPEVAGGAGLLVPPTDVAGWAGAIGRVLGDAVLRRDLAARSRERAGSFSWRSTARQTLEAYRVVAGRGKG